MMTAEQIEEIEALLPRLWAIYDEFKNRQLIKQGGDILKEMLKCED